MPHVDRIQPSLDVENLAGMDLDVGRLALKAAGGLVGHDPGVRQGEALAFGAGAKQKRAHRGRLADADRRESERTYCIVS